MIRRAAGRDAAALAALMRTLNASPQRHPERITAPGVTRDLIADSRVVLLVADEGDMLQGFVSGHPIYDSATSRWGFMMNDLYVAPAARRQGLGRELVAALATEAARDGGEALWWSARESDAPALAFHRAIGAEETPARTFCFSGAAFQEWAGET